MNNISEDASIGKKIREIVKAVLLLLLGLTMTIGVFFLIFWSAGIINIP